jgi:HK97 family phage major capsid protein
MTTTEPTQALRDQRARHLDQIDDIVRTAKERGQSRLSAADQALVDRHTTAADVLAETLSELGGTDAVRSGTTHRKFSAPNVNVRGAYSAGADSDMTRNLDAVLWATADKVPTGTGAFNPVEQVVVRSSLNDPGTPAPRITRWSADHRDAVRGFQETVAEMSLFGLMVDRDARTSAHGFEVARSSRQYAERWNEVCRALDVDTSGSGGTWVPTGIGASMHERVRAAGKVAPLFARFDMPSNPFKWPVEGTDATAYRVAEPTSDTATKVAASTPGTVAATFDAEIFGARTLFSRSIDADAAVAMVPFVQGKLIQAFVDAEERAILDGDTDGTHQDSDTNPAGTTDPRWAWDGLRKRALANASVATTTSTAANLAAVRKLMGKWGVNPNDLAFIIGTSSLHAVLTDTNLLTVDKMGPNATILNGQLGSIYGVPVIVSEHVREDLNASGVHDAITTTKSYMLCVNRREWVMGQRMALDVEIDDSIYRETFQRLCVAWARADFQNVGNAAGNDDTAIGYNITSGS